MKKLIIIVFTSATILTGAIADEAENTQKEIVEIGQKVSKKLLKTLVSELKKAMKEGGPLKAIEVCSKKALELTKKVSQQEGVEIKRTSFKYRNPKNAPDKYEKEALKYFENALKEKGKLPKYYVQTIDKEYRYYMPLKIKDVCLTCHGDPKHMDEKVLNKIRELYPNDKATGYTLGDFRGVIRVSIPKSTIEKHEKQHED
ncbi:Tll0287-like domain-containing protein [Persephonella sp.]